MRLLFTGGLPDAVLQAICWTLIHSIWQGLIAAVMAALIVTFTKRSVASVRYNLLVVVLSFFVLSVGITAVMQLQSVSRESHEAIATTVQPGPSSPADFETGEGMVKPGAVNTNPMEQFSDYCN